MKKLKGGRTGTRTVKITNNVGHTSLVAHDRSQVDGLLGVVLDKRSKSQEFYPVKNR